MQTLRRATRWYVALTAMMAAAAVAAAVVAVAVSSAQAMVADAELAQLRALAVLVPTFILASALRNDLISNVTLAPHVPVLIAGYLIGGWPVACIVGASGIVLSHGEPWSRRLFNNAQWALMGLAGGLVYSAIGGAPAGDLDSQGFSVGQLLPVLLSIIAVIAVNAVLMFGVLYFQEEIRPRAVWRAMVLSSIFPYFAYGLFGLLMAVLWSIGGGFAAALVLIPLLVGRWAFAQYAEKHQAYQAMIRSFVQAVETKDHYTRGHSERVSRASVMISRIIGMREDRVEALRYAGILHDVGKLGVETRVLQKTGPLTDTQYEQIKRHSRQGAEMVKGIEFLKEAHAGIFHHHERLDGLGYPLGLKGDEIPEFARVIAVADAFDSMTTTRSYRGARSVQEAIQELKNCEGTQFDGQMVAALVAALDKETWSTVAAPEAEPVEESNSEFANFDHDDPTAAPPTSLGGPLVEPARDQQFAQQNFVHDRDELRRGGWS